MKTIDDIRAIVYDPAEERAPLVARFLALPGKRHLACTDRESVTRALDGLRAEGLDSKEALVLQRFMGRFFQKCPGSPRVICCNYHLINTCFNCLYDCAYCYLNTYLNSFGVVQFTNILDVADEIEAHVAARPAGAVLRIGTGEFTDSLMMDEVTGIAASLITRMSRFPNVFLELKTKSDNVGHLLALPEKGNAVLAWTLNTERNIALYENGTAALDRRIGAARAACAAGYRIAFHFDPMIAGEGWEAEYRAVAARALAAVDPARVAWVSLGGFRYASGFREIIRARFPDEALTRAEMFPGIDGKYRYLRPRRLAMYRAMRECIHELAPDAFVYLCMEGADMWEDFAGARYASSDDLEEDIARHLRRTVLR
ncbi:MAG TPA: hypothetical protein PKM65_09205 [Spirochaetota bacterium]|nr:hypothetical protein [Spirochaetota bacterium]HNT12792.1 hypothetical protein [Spirochaetota bacterium]